MLRSPILSAGVNFMEAEVRRDTTWLRSLWPAVFLMFAAASETEAGATLDRVRSKGVLVEVTNQAYPPFSFINERSEPDGFDVDVAREVAKRLGVTLEVHAPSWEVIVSGQWGGRWDICICSMTPTKERREIFDFVQFYYATPTTVVVNKDETKLRSAADLTGKRVGAEAGSTYEKYLNKALIIATPDGNPAPPISYPFAALEVVPYQSEGEAFQDLALGSGKRLDAIVTNYVTALDRVKKEGRFKAVGDSLYFEPNYVAVEKGDPEFNELISSIIRDLKQNGTLRTLSIKWTGIDVTNY